MRTLIAVLDRVLLVLRHVFLAAANLILAAMLVANAFNIFTRAAFGTAFNPIFPWTVIGFVWLTFVGFYVFVYDRRDVVVDMVVSRLPLLVRRFAAVLAVAITLALLVIILATMPELLASQSDRMDMVGIPRYSMALPLFVSAALVLVLTLRRIPEIWRGIPDDRHVPEGVD